MPTWHRCAPPILFWHWHSFNLIPSSCITWIFFVDSHWWVPLRVQCPTIDMPFRQIIMYILQCPHDIHVLVHLFCFDLHKFLLRSHAATCPTSNCGRETSLFRQEPVYFGVLGAFPLKSRVPKCHAGRPHQWADICKTRKSLTTSFTMWKSVHFWLFGRTLGSPSIFRLNPSCFPAILSPISIYVYNMEAI